MGEQNAEEIINCVKFIIEKKFCNPQKIVVSGASNGGYLTCNIQKNLFLI